MIPWWNYSDLSLYCRICVNMVRITHTHTQIKSHVCIVSMLSIPTEKPAGITPAYKCSSCVGHKNYSNLCGYHVVFLLQHLRCVFWSFLLLKYSGGEVDSVCAFFNCRSMCIYVRRIMLRLHRISLFSAENLFFSVWSNSITKIYLWSSI